MADAEDKEESGQVEIISKVAQFNFIPPVYSRQLKLFGFVVWSDSRQLDEDLFYERITSRINGELAKEVLTLRAKIQR